MPKKPTPKSNASPSTTDDWMAPVLTADEEADVEIVEKQESKGKGKKSKGSRRTGSKGKNASANTMSKSSSMNLKPKSASKQMPIRKKTKGKKGSRSKSSTQSLDRATGGADTSRNSAAGTSNSKKGPIICGSRKKGSKTKGSKSPSKKKVRTPGPCAVKVKKGNRRRRPKKASKKKSKESDSRPPSSMTSSQSESVDEGESVCSSRCHCQSSVQQFARFGKAVIYHELSRRTRRSSTASPLHQIAMFPPSQEDVSGRPPRQATRPSPSVVARVEEYGALRGPSALQSRCHGK
ncbi:hypothetical protein OSTOST_25565 [Ostertagia ostertagi]